MVAVRERGVNQKQGGAAHKDKHDPQHQQRNPNPALFNPSDLHVLLPADI